MFVKVNSKYKLINMDRELEELLLEERCLLNSIIEDGIVPFLPSDERLWLFQSLFIVNCLLNNSESPLNIMQYD